MTPDPNIVTAEIVEVPKPERPELWAALYQPVERSWMISGLAKSLDKLKVACYTATLPWIPIRIPGTATHPQPAAPVTDAVAELMAMEDVARVEFDKINGGCYCDVYSRSGRKMAMESGSNYQAAVSACLAKIRGQA